MIYRMIKFRSLAVLFVILTFRLQCWSQVTVERSNDKVVISGVTYYLHLVKKGETIYSISRAYGLTTGELIKENPSAASGLKEGQSLRIRANLVSPRSEIRPAVSTVTVRDENKFIYHKLQPGETIYSLSRKYSFS